MSEPLRRLLNVRRLALLSVGIAVAPASAQRAAEVDLVRWDSTLVATVRVAELPAAGDAPTVDGRSHPTADVLWRLRHAELVQDRREVGQLLRWATALAQGERRSAWGPYLAARALLTLQQLEVPPAHNEGQFDGEAYADAIWRHLHAALERERGFRPARQRAIELLLAAGDRSLGPDQQRALALLATTAMPEPGVLLVRGREQRRLGQLDSALALFTAAGRLGASPGHAALERARTLSALERHAEAGAAYWSGARASGRDVREAYRFDLAWILGPDTLARFDAVPDSGVAGWLERFWAERDAAAANQPGERLREHLRRWVKAFRDYRVFIPERRTQFARVEYLFEGLDHCVASDAELYETLARMQPTLPGDVRLLEPLLDHRGLIYLRHGEPMRRVIGGTGPSDEPGLAPDGLRNPVEGSLFRVRRSSTRAEHEDETRLKMRQNESWLYWFEGGWRLLHFRGSDALGHWAPTTLSGYLPVNGYFDEWVRRGAVLPEYAAAAARMAVERGIRERTCIPAVTAAIAKSRDDAHVGTASDSDTPPMPAAWNAVLQTFAVGTAHDSSARALVTFAIPRRALASQTIEGGSRVYPVQFRIVAYESASGRSIVIDTLRRFTSTASGQDDNLTGWLEMPLTAGTWQVAVRLSQGGDSVGAFGLQRGLVIPEARFAISDIVTGIHDSPTRWPGAGESFPLNALAAWPTGGAVELYFEVHGLPEGAGYRTTLEIVPQRGNGKTGIRVGSTDRASGALTRVRKELRLDTLAPGAYWLTVTLEAGGQTVQARRAIVVTSP